MKLFFSVFTSRNRRTFSKFELSPDPTSETRRIGDHEAVSLEIPLGHEESNPLHDWEVRRKLAEIAGRALLMLGPMQRDVLAREAGVTLHVNERTN
jgi:hypothetical protein